MFDQLENELVLKAIAWDDKIGKFVSPSHSGFVWERDGIEAATCTRKCTTGDEPPFDQYDIPGDGCLCGLYGTFRWRIIGKGYTKGKAIAPTTLVEVSGKTKLYDDGTRSYQQGIRAVINTWDDAVASEFDHLNIVGQVDQYGVRSTKAAAVQAADYFQVPILSREMATIAMDLQNARLNLLHSERRPDNENDFHYLPESGIVREMSRTEIDELVDVYLPRIEPEVKWQALFTKSR
jgi:hypothetical protein